MMARDFALCFLVLLSACGRQQVAAPPLPAGCRMATAADLPQLQIYVDVRDTFEAVDPARAAISGEPSSATIDPAYIWGDARFRLSQDGQRGHRECLAVGWKVVPVGPNPASSTDFTNGRLPSGIAVVPKDGPTSYEVYPMVRAVDDRATERNEYFRIELTDAAGDTIWGRAEPDRDERGILRNSNPKAAVFTIHDTERDCARAGDGSGFKLSVEASGKTYRLVIQQPKTLDQCAYVAWRYLDDNIPTDHHNVDMALQGGRLFPLRRGIRGAWRIPAMVRPWHPG